MNVTLAGAGYVGLANAFLLAKYNNVTVFDINEQKINLLNKRILPIKDKDMEQAFADEKLRFAATFSPTDAFDNADYIIIATPTDYDAEQNHFDTSSIEMVLDNVVCEKSSAVVIIRSTVPVGYTKHIRERYCNLNIIFVPEFLREGKALYDNLYPSRIVIGDKSEVGHEFAELLLAGAKKKDVPVVFTDSTEAEAIKLFANTYLAMRVAYFNELDFLCGHKKS